MLSKLVPLIRFPHIEKGYLINKIKPLEIVPTDLYIEALEFIAIGMDQNLLASPSQNHRFRKRFSAPPPSPAAASSFSKKTSSTRKSFLS